MRALRARLIKDEPSHPHVYHAASASQRYAFMTLQYCDFAADYQFSATEQSRLARLALQSTAPSAATMPIVITGVKAR